MIDGFVRLIPKQGFSEWKNTIREMADLCRETEYQLVKKGHRKAATLHIKDENYKELTEKINRDGLIFTPILKARLSVGFSHEHQVAKEGEPHYWYGCVTRNYEDGQIFKKAEGTEKNSITDHKKIGKLLGYPDCCIEYFDKHFSKNWDPLWVNKSGLVEGYIECNRILRYFGIQLSWHFSCSPVCKKTEEKVKEWIVVMKEIDAELTNKVINLLGQNMTWDSYHGVVQVETPYFLGLSHTFPYLKKKRIINWQKKK